MAAILPRPQCVNLGIVIRTNPLYIADAKNTAWSVDNIRLVKLGQTGLYHSIRSKWHKNGYIWHGFALIPTSIMQSLQLNSNGLETNFDHKLYKMMSRTRSKPHA